MKLAYIMMHRDFFLTPGCLHTFLSMCRETSVGKMYNKVVKWKLITVIRLSNISISRQARNSFLKAQNI